ncbi:hypothetical protein Tco_0733008 [Tanacetum coccineum]
MIKEHDQQAKVKATPRRLAYADSDKEALASQRIPFKSKEPEYLRRSRRLKDRSTTKEKARRERSKPRGKRSRYQETSSNSKYEEGGATRNWFNDLDPKSVDTFEELSQKFLEEFSQHKRYAKDPTEIYGIKRRYKEGLQAFMDRLKFKSSHIKGVPPVLRISAFMHGHGHLELAKKLNDKIPKTVDEMFKRVRAFIRGEVVTGSAKLLTDKPIILEGVIKGNQVRRILVDDGISSEIMRNVSSSRNNRSSSNYRKGKKKQNSAMEFTIIKFHSPYNVIIGRTRMRSFGAVGSTIHSMIKFPTNQGIVTMETTKEALGECRHLERVQGSWKEV